MVSTPLGTPVVPDVYICTITSAASPRPPGSRGSCASIQRSYSSPTTISAGGRTCSATSRKAGPAISTGASESARTAASSGTASRQLSGTSTAPILLAANSSSTTSGDERSR